jgi:hypothetical protein
MLSEVVTYFLENYDSGKPMYKKHMAVLPMFLQVVGDRPVDQLNHTTPPSSMRPGASQQAISLLKRAFNGELLKSKR